MFQDKISITNYPEGTVIKTGSKKVKKIFYKLLEKGATGLKLNSKESEAVNQYIRLSHNSNPRTPSKKELIDYIKYDLVDYINDFPQETEIILSLLAYGIKRSITFLEYIHIQSGIRRNDFSQDFLDKMLTKLFNQAVFEEDMDINKFRKDLENYGNGLLRRALVLFGLQSAEPEKYVNCRNLIIETIIKARKINLEYD